MWHQTEDSKFNHLNTRELNFRYLCMAISPAMIIMINTVMTEHIVDVREGQNSDGFDRYPYEEMKDQSLSILIEGEKQSIDHNNHI